MGTHNAPYRASNVLYQMLCHFEGEEFLNLIVTGDEIWTNNFTLEINEQLICWRCIIAKIQKVKAKKIGEQGFGTEKGCFGWILCLIEQ